jgi:hypothetical protein
VTTAQSSDYDGEKDYLLVLPEGGAVTVARAQFITTDIGANLIDTSIGDPVIAGGAGTAR